MNDKPKMNPTLQLLFGTPGQILSDQNEADFTKIFKQAEERKNFYGPVEAHDEKDREYLRS